MDLSDALVESIETPEAINAASGLLEVALDALLDEGLARDIPVIGTVVALARTGAAIRDRILVKKILRFLTELGEVPERERARFGEKLRANPGHRREVGETLIGLLDRLRNLEVLTQGGLGCFCRNQGPSAYLVELVGPEGDHRVLRSGKPAALEE